MTHVICSVAINALLTEMCSITMHKKCIYAFTLPQWLGERATVLRHTYIAQSQMVDKMSQTQLVHILFIYNL